MKVSTTQLENAIKVLPPVKDYFYNPTVSIPVTGNYDMCSPRAGSYEEIKFHRVREINGYEWALEINSDNDENKRLKDKLQELEVRYVHESRHREDLSDRCQEFKDQIDITFWRMLGLGLLIGGAFGILIQFMFQHSK